MSLDEETRKVLGICVSSTLVILAVWLVSPFIKIDAADYAHASRNAYRLILGLLILIIFLGKWVFDVFAPQGLAKKISTAKSVVLIVLSILILGFIIYILAQAVSVYLEAGLSQDAEMFLPQ